VSSTIRRRKPRFGYLQILNAVIRDYRVSWRARGLLAELLSYPEGYETTVDELVKKAKRSGGNVEGRDSMRTAARELKNVGYIVETKHQNELGQWITELEVTDDPMYDLLAPGNDVSAGRADDGIPGVGFPGVGKPAVGKPGVNKKTEKKTEKKEGEEGDAHAGASPDPIQSDDRQWGVTGGRQPERASMASADLISDIARGVLTNREALTVEEHQELAALADAAVLAVDAHSGLKWDEYVAWLKQGWFRPDGRKAFNIFSATLRWRLLPEQIQKHAWPWAYELRASQKPSEAQGAREPQFSKDAINETTCAIHRTKTLNGVCLPCQAEAEAEERRLQEEEARARQEQEDAEAAAAAEAPEDVPELDPAVVAERAKALREADEKAAQSKVSALQAYRQQQAERERQKADAKKLVDNLRLGDKADRLNRAW